MSDGTSTKDDAVAPTAHDDSGLLATAAWSAPTQPTAAARFASPGTSVLPAPAPPPDAPSAVPQAVSPAGTWEEFESTSRPTVEDTSFYRNVAVSDPKPERTRNSENDLFCAPKRQRPKHLLAMIAATLAIIAAGGAALVSIGTDTSAPASTPPKASTTEVSAAATGTTPEAIQIPTAATSGKPYSLALPPGWSATGRLTGPASRHIDLTLSSPALGIEATISSTRVDAVGDPKEDVPTAASAVTTITTTFAGESGRGARWTLDGVRHEEFTLVHAGTTYTLTAHAPVANTSQLNADLKSLRRSWKFAS